mgnify:CR=1 FL=1
MDSETGIRYRPRKRGIMRCCLSSTCKTMEKAVLEAIDQPSVELSSPKAVLEEGLKHERYVTSLIHNLYDAAYSVKDFRTMQFLDWFVKEQGEEENNADDLIKKYELFGDDPKSLYLLDNELASRVYAAPSLVL